MKFICNIGDAPINFPDENGTFETTLAPGACGNVTDEQYSYIDAKCTVGVDFEESEPVGQDALDAQKCCMQPAVEAESTDGLAGNPDGPYPVINADGCFLGFVQPDGTADAVTIKPELNQTYGDATGTSIDDAGTPVAPPTGDKDDGDTHSECHDDGISEYLCVGGAWVLQYVKKTGGETTTYESVDGVIDFDNKPATPPTPPTDAVDGDQHNVEYHNGDLVYELQGGVWTLVDTDKEYCPAVTDIENFSNDGTNSTFDSPDESGNEDLHYEVAYIILEDGSQVLATETPNKASMPAYQSGNSFNFANTGPITNNMTKVHEIYDGPDCATAVLISRTVKICQVKKFVTTAGHALACPLVFPFTTVDGVTIADQAAADAYALGLCPGVAFDSDTCEYVRIVDEGTPPIEDMPVQGNAIARVESNFTDATGNGDYDITLELLGCDGQTPAVAGDLVQFDIKDITNGLFLETLTGKVGDDIQSFTSSNAGAGSVLNFVTPGAVVNGFSFMFAKKTWWRSQPSWYKNGLSIGDTDVRQVNDCQHAGYNPIELQLCVTITPQSPACETSTNSDNFDLITTHKDFDGGFFSNIFGFADGNGGYFMQFSLSGLGSLGGGKSSSSYKIYEEGALIGQGTDHQADGWGNNGGTTYLSDNAYYEMIATDEYGMETSKGESSADIDPAASNNINTQRDVRIRFDSCLDDALNIEYKHGDYNHVNRYNDATGDLYWSLTDKCNNVVLDSGTRPAHNNGQPLYQTQASGYSLYEFYSKIDSAHYPIAAGLIYDKTQFFIMGY